MLKGALHIHTDVSCDSDISYPQLKKIFKSSGYNFIGTCEHAEYLNQEKYEIIKEEAKRLSDDSFLIVPGIEIKWQEKAHLLAFGAKNYMPNEENLDLDETIKKIRKTTRCKLLVYAHFNHPVKLNNDTRKILNRLDGIEIFNYGYHGGMFPDAEGLKYMDTIKKQSDSPIALAGLDLHRINGFNRLPFIIQNLNKPEENSIFEELKKGNFYAQGKLFTLKQSQVKWPIIMLITLFNNFFNLLNRIKNRMGVD